MRQFGVIGSELKELPQPLLPKPTWIKTTKKNLCLLQIWDRSMALNKGVALNKGEWTRRIHVAVPKVLR